MSKLIYFFLFSLIASIGFSSIRPIHLTPISLINYFFAEDQQTKKYCQKHLIYALDSSGSMAGPSWELVKDYLNQESLLLDGQIVSSFKFTNNITLNRIHAQQIVKIFTPSIGNPSGRANYLTGLFKIRDLLNLFSTPSQQFIINIISDGFVSFAPEEVALLQLLKTHRKGPCRRTINCVQTKNYSEKSNFEKFCNAAGLTVKYLQQKIVPWSPSDGQINERSGK